MVKLVQMGLVLIAALGLVAQPAKAVEPNRSSSDATQLAAGLAILGAGTAIVAYSAKQRGLQTEPPHHRSAPVEKANPRLQQKLLRLLHNDRKTAHRLLTYVQQTHPDRSPNWVLEKVIYDLERDRNRH